MPMPASNQRYIHTVASRQELRPPWFFHECFNLYMPSAPILVQVPQTWHNGPIHSFIQSCRQPLCSKYCAKCWANWRINTEPLLSEDLPSGRRETRTWDLVKRTHECFLEGARGETPSVERLLIQS